MYIYKNLFTFTVHNQQRVMACGGLEAVVNFLHRAVNRLSEANKNVQLAVCLTNTLDAVLADNGILY